MSRHELTPVAGRQGIEVALGWDPPLSTYFAIVRFGDDLVGSDDADADPILVWIGTSYAEIRSSSVVIDAARDFARIPAGLQETLRSDRKLNR